MIMPLTMVMLVLVLVHMHMLKDMQSCSCSLHARARARARAHAHAHAHAHVHAVRRLLQSGVCCSHAYPAIMLMLLRMHVLKQSCACARPCPRPGAHAYAPDARPCRQLIDDLPMQVLLLCPFPFPFPFPC